MSKNPLAPHELEPLVKVLKDALVGPAYNLALESDVQAKMKRILEGAYVESEYVLGPGERIDFFFPGPGLGIEVKITRHNNAVEIFKQLERYAKHGEIKGLILATSYFMGLPPEINGKPVWLFHLSRGML